MPQQVTPEIRDPSGFAAAFPVSRETLDRLVTYETLLKRWQNTINLVAPSTVNHLWHRHFADSAQLWWVGQQTWTRPCEPSPDGLPSPSRGEDQIDHWLDIGSGAGFPGLVIAILAAEHGRTRHTLIESDSRKAAFLREVARSTGVVVDILCTRIEIPQTRVKVGEVDCITARALAPLPRLVELAYPYFGPGTIGLFSKGREVSAEIEDAARAWTFKATIHPSVTDSSGSVLVLKSLTRQSAL